MQHVGIGEHDVAALANRFARIRGCVAVIGKHAEAVIEPRREIVQFGELILGQRLGGEKIERARVRIFQNGVQNWQVVAERFSGSCRRDYHDVAAIVRFLRRRSLMAVQLFDAFLGIYGGQFGTNPRGHGRKDSVACRNSAARRSGFLRGGRARQAARQFHGRA